MKVSGVLVMADFVLGPGLDRLACLLVALLWLQRSVLLPWIKVPISH
jgi:hypothetical protein